MTARVLVVDDILANIKLLEARLMAEYFEVLTANSGEEAIEVCGRERVDIVLLDVMMPGTLNGLDVCSRIKSAPGMRHTKVIMLTARVQSDDRAAGFAAGADDYLMKPFSTLQVLETSTAWRQRSDFAASAGTCAPGAARHAVL